MSKLKEHIAVHDYSRSIGTTNGFHPEDDPFEDEDALYNTRSPSSVRRYTVPPTSVEMRTVMRVTRHQAPPQRASRQIQAPRQQTTRPPIPAPTRLHWLGSLGIGMFIMAVLWVTLSGLGQWWQAEQDMMHYGYPRTFQCDADVRHSGMSHFIVVNLHGHILITEIQINDLQNTKVYTGPVFSGPGTDLEPATIRFQDVNGDGYPDMIIAVGTGRYIYINDHHGFRPTTPTDKTRGEIN